LQNRPKFDSKKLAFLILQSGGRNFTGVRKGATTTPNTLGVSLRWPFVSISTSCHVRNNFPIVASFLAFMLHRQYSDAFEVWRDLNSDHFITCLLGVSPLVE